MAKDIIKQDNNIRQEEITVILNHAHKNAF
ncbi:MAG: hypothetical protein QG588_3 [Candidatus Poribacteria bacterium]|nr:hypothetical protein [Candidatus Poribacteria bacterium]